MEHILLFFATYHPVRHLLLAILILVLGHWLVKRVTRWIERAMTHAQIETTVTRFVLHISHFILLIVVVIILSS
jgi:Mechanosensitive ion channel, conserved TM helix